MLRLCVLGASRPIDLLAVYNDGKLLNFGSMLACCGFFGDVIQKSETNRQLGAGRYPYASECGILYDDDDNGD